MITLKELANGGWVKFEGNKMVACYGNKADMMRYESGYTVLQPVADFHPTGEPVQVRAGVSVHHRMGIVLDEIQRGNKINAIKELRNITQPNFGLKLAKEMVESIAEAIQK